MNRFIEKCHFVLWNYHISIFISPYSYMILPVCSNIRKPFIDYSQYLYICIIMEKQSSEISKQRQSKRHRTQFINIGKLIDDLKAKGQAELTILKGIMREASNLLKHQPNMLKIRTPLVIVGDIHGQFYDLLNLVNKFGDPSKTKYLFLGDYVDRGKFCIETITLILTFKLAYPNNVFLLRGNHQGRTMTSYFNFKTECQKKYNSEIYEDFIDLFCKLPLAAHIDNKYFAVHGGISPNLNTLSELQKVNRQSEIPQSGTMCDLLWSDPIEESHQQWQYNKMRSCSYYYSRNQTLKFLNSNKLSLIIRGHQVQTKGYKYQHGINNEPLTLTIFSAPRYCDTHKNKGAVALLNGKSIQIRSFKEVEHPFVSPNYLNAFELSFPVIASSVTKLFSYFLKSKKVKKSFQAHSQNSKEVAQLFQTLQSVENMQAYLSTNVNLLTDLMRTGQQVLPCPENVRDYLQKQKHGAEIFGPKRDFVRVAVQRQEEDVEPQPIYSTKAFK